VWSLNFWISLSKKAINELLFWQQLPRLIFEMEIWPSQKGVSIKVATDASDFAWVGHTLGGPLLTAKEYFTVEESMKSSIFRELLEALRCLQALVHLCIGKFVVMQVDAQNLLGIINRGSNKLAINKLARDLFWFGFVNGMTLSVEWVQRLCHRSPTKCGAGWSLWPRSERAGGQLRKLLCLRLCVFVALCALNTAKHVAYPIRTYGTVPYGTVPYRTSSFRC